MGRWDSHDLEKMSTGRWDGHELGEGWDDGTVMNWITDGTMGRSHFEKKIVTAFWMGRWDGRYF